MYSTFCRVSHCCHCFCAWSNHFKNKLQQLHSGPFHCWTFVHCQKIAKSKTQCIIKGHQHDDNLASTLTTISFSSKPLQPTFTFLNMVLNAQMTLLQSNKESSTAFMRTSATFRKYHPNLHYGQCSMNRQPCRPHVLTLSNWNDRSEAVMLICDLTIPPLTLHMQHNHAVAWWQKIACPILLHSLMQMHLITPTTVCWIASPNTCHLNYTPKGPYPHTTIYCSKSARCTQSDQTTCQLPLLPTRSPFAVTTWETPRPWCAIGTAAQASSPHYPTKEIVAPHV